MFSGLCPAEFLFLTILLYLILVGKIFFLGVNSPPFECPFGIYEGKLHEGKLPARNKAHCTTQLVSAYFPVTPSALFLNSFLNLTSKVFWSSFPWQFGLIIPSVPMLSQSSCLSLIGMKSSNFSVCLNWNYEEKLQSSLKPSSCIIE